MRHFTMYVDESGRGSLGNSSANDNYFVLTGLIVEDKQDIELSSYFKHIKRRHGIDEDISLHAYDLFENKNDILYFKDNSKCKNFTASIVEFVENGPFQVFVTCIDKNELMKKIGAPKGYTFKGSRDHKEDKDLPYEILVRKLLFEFTKILKKEKAIGSIIAESRRGADRVFLGAYLDTQQPSLFEKYENMKKLSKEAKERIHSICFAGKRSLKGGLELVDIISYFSYNYLVNKFPIQRNDRRGLKESWAKIKNNIYKKELQRVKGSEINKLANDRIHETSSRVKLRLSQFNDLIKD